MIKVIIERKIIEGGEAQYQAAILRLLREIREAPGYVSGETYQEIGKPSHYIVIANWVSMESWDRWLRSRERFRVISEISPYLEEEEKFVILEKQTYSK